MSRRTPAALAIVVAVLILAPMPVFAKSPDPASQATSQPAHDPIQTGERAELDRLIRSHLNSIRQSGPNALTDMIDHAESLQYLAERIDRFLSEHPEDPAFERLTLSKLDAIYISCTIKGDGLERMKAEADRLATSKSPELREVADYWHLRIRLNDIDSREALGEQHEGEANRLMRAFIVRYPASIRSVPMIQQVVTSAIDSGEVAEIDPLLGLMSRYHPNHPASRTLEGRVRLIRNRDQPWRPRLTTPAGRDFDWNAMTGLPTVVVFWASSHSPSLKALGVLKSIRARYSDVQFNIVTIAMERDSDAAITMLGQLELNCYQTIERDVWKSKLTFKYGVRSLPTILLLDESQKLKNIIEPREWNTGPRLTVALATLLKTPLSLNPEPTTAPVSSQPAEIPTSGPSP